MSHQESEFIQPWRTEKLGLKPLQLTEGLLEKIDAFKIPTIIACSSLLCGPEHERPKDYADYIKMAGFVFVPSAKEGFQSAARTCSLVYMCTLLLLLYLDIEIHYRGY
jgi:hypothetical protein